MIVSCVTLSHDCVMCLYYNTISHVTFSHDLFRTPLYVMIVSCSKAFGSRVQKLNANIVLSELSSRYEVYLNIDCLNLECRTLTTAAPPVVLETP